MSKTNCGESNFKQRYKGIENFLRRVAFNLGNTPSQTEVKIISCIPVDVTDLQQKVFQLQKELEEAKASNSSKKICPAKTTCCHTVCETVCSACNPCKARSRTTKKARRCESSDEELSGSNEVCSTGTSRHTDTSPSHLRSSCSAMNISHSSRNSSTGDRGKCKNKCWRNFLKKKAACKKKCKAQFVYCAQTNTSAPFRKNFSLSDDLTSNFYRDEVRRGRFSDELTSQNFSKQATKSDTLSRSYVEEMLQKQYKPQLIINGFSNLSEFSSPICRDNMTNCMPYESEVCSCCHDSFQDIDKHMNRGSNFVTHPTCDNVGNYIRNTYYDSNLYDLVPVKEKTAKKRNEIEIQKRTNRNKQTIKCWPERARPKYKVPFTITNNRSVTTVRDYKRRTPHAKLLSKKDLVVNKMVSKPYKFNLPRPEKDDIDIGQIYTKQVKKHRKLKKQNNSSTLTRMRSVGTCSPTALINTDCQTAIENVNANNQSEAAPLKDKTEATLNQIKDILQSVLTEVKTNSKLTTSIELAKKDANVQNGPSHGYEFGESKMLHSYTYRPYNIDPYVATCSHQLTSNTYTSYPEYPGFQATHLQHYPLLIQPQKHMCTNCLRNSHVSKMINTTRAASAATNTDHPHERSKETERLIKEIYNSMALTFEMPSEITTSEYTKPKSVIEKSDDSVRIESSGEPIPKRGANAVSELFRNKHPHDSSTLATNTATTLFSNLDPNERKFRSRSTVKKESHKRMHFHKYNSTTETMDVETEQNSRELVMEEQSDSKTINEETEPSSSESETPDTVGTKKLVKDTKKEKSGIFKKMLKIFQPKQRERKQRIPVKEAENETESDSDDYQTVYSHKIAPPPPKNVVDMRIRPRSKVIFFSKQPQQRKIAKTPERHSKTSPYMEQEYRRYWDEKLMFHENKRRRYSTDISRDTMDYRKQRRPVYHQNYEARTVLVNPARRMPLNNYTNYENMYDRNKRYVPLYRVRPYMGNNQNCERVVQVVNSSNSAATINASSRYSKPHYIIYKNSGQRKSIMAAKGLAWMKKHTLCQQWKDLIRDS